eukprot:COSAG06_NODE_63939_length_261_cov_0.537037_1_plen_32_part_01
MFKYTATTKTLPRQARDKHRERTLKKEVMRLR